MIILPRKQLEVLDQIHASEELKTKTLQNTLSHRKKKPSLYLKYVVSACFVVLCFSIFVNQKSDAALPEEQYSYIAIDINPSFELILNEQDKVIDVKQYNDDAIAIFKDLDIKGYVYEDAMGEVINALEEQAYLLPDSYLQVSVYSKDEVRMQSIESAISAYLNTTMQTPHGCMHVDEQTHEQAQSHHMSFGKYDLAQLIVTLDDQYTIEVLNKLSMIELRNIYSSLTNEPWSGSGDGNCGNSGKQHMHNQRGKNKE